MAPLNRFFMQRLFSSLASGLMVLALCTVELPAAEPVIADAQPGFTTEQASALEALKGELARLDPLLEKVEEPDHKAWVKHKVGKLKERFRELEKIAFDQTKFDELRFDVNIEYQRLALWLRPPLAPAKAKAK
ncbi:MAG: hypothetical protein ABIZ81_07430 [Opitutaceae bacterium]